MRLIIAGPRDYDRKAAPVAVGLSVMAWMKRFGAWPSEIISGGASGIDRAGIDWAKARHLPFHVEYFAKKERLLQLGYLVTSEKAGGPVRNAWMAERATKGPTPGGLVIVRDTREHTAGTDSMLEIGKARGLWVLEWRP